MRQQSYVFLYFTIWIYPTVWIFFISGEHILIGDAIKLHKPGGGGGSSAQRPLTLPNGLKLSYGQIIALGGDFYGVPKEPIVDPTEKPNERVSGRCKRFMAAYSTLAHDHVKEEVDQKLKIMTEEKSAIEDELVEKWDKVTGGKWIFGVPVAVSYTHLTLPTKLEV